MKKELVFAIAALAASCGRPTEPRAASQDPLVFEAPLVSPEPTSTVQGISHEERSSIVMTQAGEIFLEQLTQMSAHPDLLISGMHERLLAGQRSGNLEIRMSQPWFDTEGNLGNREQDPRLFCGYDENGNFLIIVNSNFYVAHSSYPPEASAALLDECFNFQEAIENRYQVFLESSPNFTLADALKLNPDWEFNSILDAWYKTATEILAPYRDGIPVDDPVLNFVLKAYDASAGDEGRFREIILGSSEFEHL